MSERRRDLLAIAETVGPYLTDGQIGQAIEFLLRLAGEGCRRADDVERRRTERDVTRAPSCQREP